MRFLQILLCFELTMVLKRTFDFKNVYRLFLGVVNYYNSVYTIPCFPIIRNMLCFGMLYKLTDMSVEELKEKNWQFKISLSLSVLNFKKPLWHFPCYLSLRYVILWYYKTSFRQRLVICYAVKLACHLEDHWIETALARIHPCENRRQL